MATVDQGHFQHEQDVNVSHGERAGVIVAGGMLALWGLRRRSTFGALAALLGGGLIYIGMTGHCEVYESMGIDNAHDDEGAQSGDDVERGVHAERSSG